MKKLIHSFLTLLLCLSLYIQVSAQEDLPMSENEQIVREFITAWSNLDPGELASYFTEDGTYHNIPSVAVNGRGIVLTGKLSAYWQMGTWSWSSA